MPNLRLSSSTSAPNQCVSQCKTGSEMPLEGLLGLVFAIRRSSNQPEIIFQHPPPLNTDAFLPDGGGSLPSPRVSGRRKIAPIEKWGISENLRVGCGFNLASGPSLTSSSQGFHSTSALLSYNTPASANRGSGPNNDVSCLGRPLDAGSVVRMKWQCFGVASQHLANLILPPDLLCNQGFELEIDPGPANLPGSENKAGSSYQHIKFVCFPRCVGRQNGLAPASHGEKVEKFTLCLVFDSRFSLDVDSIFLIAANLSSGLLVTETKFGYLSNEVNKICALIHSTRTEPVRADRVPHLAGNLDSGDSDATVNGVAGLIEKIHGQSSLAQTLRHLYKQLIDGGSAHLLLDGCIACHLTSYPVHRIEMPKWYRAAVLLNEEKEVQDRLPVDRSMYLRHVMKALNPDKSIMDIALELCINLPTIKHIIQHLVSWRIAKVVDRICDNQIYTVNTNRGNVVRSRLVTEFQTKFKDCCLPFCQILSLFGQERTLGDIRGVFKSRHSASDSAESTESLYSNIIFWLIKVDAIVLIRKYYMFSPLVVTSESGNAGLPFGARIACKFNDERLPIDKDSNFDSVISLPCSVAERIVAKLRQYFAKHSRLQEFSFHELLTLYLFIREQHLISYNLPSLDQAAPTSEVSTIPWTTSAQLERAMLLDLSNMEREGLAEYTERAYIFLMDFVSGCIWRPVDELSIGFELNELALCLFVGLIQEKRFGVFSDCIVDYIC